MRIGSDTGDDAILYGITGDELGADIIVEVRIEEPKARLTHVVQAACAKEIEPL